MSIENSPLYDSIVNLVEENETKAFYRWQCLIRAGDEEITPISVNSVAIHRDYRENYSDVTMVELNIGVNDYNNRLFPYKEELILFLTKIIVNSKGEEIVDTDNINVYQYRGTLTDGWSPSIQDYGEVADSKNTMDHTTTIPVLIQLTRYEIEILRQCTLSGIFHETSVTDLLKTILRADWTNKEILDGIFGIDMLEANNNKTYDHIIVPPGTLMINIPDLIQKSCGVYTSGLGNYIQNGIWYLYPLFRINLFNLINRKVTVVSVPENKYLGADITYNYTDGQLYLLAIGPSGYSDERSALARNIGNGVIYQNAATVINEYTKLSEGTLTANYNNNILKYIAYEREDGQNFTPFYTELSSSNHCLPSEGISVTQCTIFTFIWNNGDPDLIQPCTPVRYIYNEKDDVIILYGVIIGINYESESKGKGVLNDVHSNRIVITALLEPLKAKK